MKINEKNTSNQEENSTSSNNDNEFQELDNEIEKVVRGETSFEDEKDEKNNIDFNNPSNTTENFANYKDNKLNNNEINNNINSNLNNKDRIDIKNSNKNHKNLFPQKPLNSLNISNNYINLTNSNNMNFNNVNIINFVKNYENNYQNNINNNKYYNNKNIENQNLIRNNNPIFNLNQNNCNNNINELLFLLSNISNGCINNIQNSNKMKIYEYINNLNNQFNKGNNNNEEIKNSNVNNIPLFSGPESNLNCPQFQRRNLKDNFCNNMVINNQFYTPININLQFTNNNNNNDLNKNINYFKLINNKNNLNYNGFNNIINNNLSQNFKNNNIPIDLYTLNNVNINKQIKENEEINFLKKIENKLKNHNNSIDLISSANVNNINDINNINNKLILNHINNKNSTNFKDIKKINSNYQMNNFNQAKIGNNSIKRKIFNPLPESEKEKNIINLMDIFQCKDLRTTLMIKNIPNKYTISTFLSEINENFKNTYDIFYLPIDYINKCNLGFAFINFVEPFHIILFYELYRGKKWKKFNSDKKCELLYAKFQGRKELISHFEKGKVLLFDSEEKRPLILPVPHPLPKINLPFYYLDLFVKLYPNILYEIKNIEIYNKRNAISLLKVFSIEGKFHNN